MPTQKGANKGYSMAKVCPRCKSTYMFAEKHFYKDKSRKDGLNPICKKCKYEDIIFCKSKKIIQKPLFSLTCDNEKCNTIFTTRRTDKKFCCKKCRDNQFYLTKFKEGYGDKRAFKARFERSKENPKNARLKWKNKDIAKLIELREAKIPYKEIAKVLKRGVDACIIKYKNIKKDMLDRKIIVKVDTISNTK